MNQEKLKQLQAQVRIGGKGTARRKKKVVHRTATTDDKKLQSSLKKLSVSSWITVIFECLFLSYWDRFSLFCRLRQFHRFDQFCLQGLFLISVVFADKNIFRRLGLFSVAVHYVD